MNQQPTTEELLKRLKNIKTESALYTYTLENTDYSLITSFPEYLESCRKSVGITAAQLIESAQIQRNYGYQILNVTKHPGRNKVIALCLALHLSYEEVQRALTLAKEGSLYPKNSRDSVLIFCINKKMSVMETNDLLDIRGEELL